MERQTSKGRETPEAEAARLRSERDEERKLREEATGLSAGPKNIQQKLDQQLWRHGPDEEAAQGLPGQWWQSRARSGDGADDDTGDRSMQVNRLRTMARVRAAFRDPETGEAPVWARDFPRMVVVGDGNTGKSTVLNRFAGFDFSAVSDGVCTRRPIRLELRAASVSNHKRIKDEGLDAICTVSDYRGDCIHGKLFEGSDENPRVFDMPGDAEAVRREVERLASAADLGARAASDADYTTDELVIRYEAPGMIHFDLVDLPGIDNDHPMTQKLVKHYINANSLDNTFMLIFQAATRGSTSMKYSICVDLIKKVAEQCRQQGHDDWLTSHCLGTLTMYDRELQEKKGMQPEAYDKKYAQQLWDWLNCTDHTEKTLKFDWVTTLVRVDSFRCVQSRARANVFANCFSLSSESEQRRTD